MSEIVPYFQFRALYEFDGKHNLIVGYCLETGNVVTADDMDTAKQIMKEVLEDEIYNAVKFKNYENLLSKPAPKPIWDRWYELRKTKEPDVVFLNVRNEQVNQDDTETSARVEVVGAA